MRRSGAQVSYTWSREHVRDAVVEAWRRNSPEACAGVLLVAALVELTRLNTRPTDCGVECEDEYCEACACEIGNGCTLPIGYDESHACRACGGRW